MIPCFVGNVGTKSQTTLFLYERSEVIGHYCQKAKHSLKTQGNEAS